MLYGGSCVFPCVRCVCFVFERREELLEKTTAVKTETKYRKNVILWCRRSPIAFTVINDYSKSKYEYKVGDRSYIAKLEGFVHPSLMPYMARVVHVKRFPRLARVIDDITDDAFPYMIYSLVALGFGAVFAAMGVFCVI